MSPNDYNPLLSFRFKVIFSTLEGLEFYGKSITLPEAENNPLTVEYGNTYIKLKGKTKWNDVTMTCYAFENVTHDRLWNWLNSIHQDITNGKDYYADQYKKDIIIQLLNPAGEVVIGSWKLINAFISRINFGAMDYTTEEIVQPEISISYDYALYESGTPKAQQGTGPNPQTV